MPPPSKQEWLVVWTDDRHLSGGPGFIFPPEVGQYGWYTSPSISRAHPFRSEKEAEVWAKRLRLEKYEILRVVAEIWHRDKPIVC